MCQLSFDSQSASQGCQSECSLVLKCSSSSSSRSVTVVINKVSRAGKRRALFTTVYVKLLTGCSASVMRLRCYCQACAAAAGGATVSSLLLSVLALASSRRLPCRWLSRAKKAGRSRQDNSCIVHTHTDTWTFTQTHTHTQRSWHGAMSWRQRTVK